MNLLASVAGHLPLKNTSKLQIRESKENFNNEVMAMKTRKELLLQELNDIQLQLIDIQYRLDASKRKPVPTIPIIYPEERHQDPFHVRNANYQSSIMQCRVGLLLLSNLNIPNVEFWHDRTSNFPNLEFVLLNQGLRYEIHIGGARIFVWK